LTRADAPNSSLAKAMGAYFAACFCKDLGIQKIIIEGDAQAVTTAICNTEINMSRFGHIISDTQQVLQWYGEWNVCLYVEILMEWPIL
jgi:hypothetical protein